MLGQIEIQGEISKKKRVADRVLTITVKIKARAK